MDPGINPNWPSLAGVAPLRVTHRSRSTASPVRGSCHTCNSSLLCSADPEICASNFVSLCRATCQRVV